MIRLFAFNNVTCLKFWLDSLLNNQYLVSFCLYLLCIFTYGTLSSVDFLVSFQFKRLILSESEVYRILKSSTVIIARIIIPFMSVNIYFMKWGVQVFGASKFKVTKYSV